MRGTQASRLATKREGLKNNVSRFQNVEFEKTKGHLREMPKEPLDYQSEAQES